MKRLLESYARKYPLDPEKIGSTWTVAPGPFSFWVTGLYLQQNRSVLVVAPSNTEAESLAAEAAWFGAQKQIVHFPGYESIPYRYAGLSWAPAVQRVRVLSRLLNGERLLIFTSADALLRRMPDRSVIERHCIRLHPELEWAPRDLLRRLIDLGYERVDQVEAPGECCLKGEILDVFPVNGEWPLRIDYFDDTIESLRNFDPESQLGRERVSEVIVYPAGEYVLDAESGQRLINILENDYPAELERPAWCRADAVLQHGLYTQFHHPGLEEFVGLVEPLSSLEQILGDVIQVRYPNGAVREAMSRITREFQTLYTEEKEQIVCVPPDELLARKALSGSASSGTVPTGLLLVDYLPGTSDPDRTAVTATAGDAPESTEYDSAPESQAITNEESTESAESTDSYSSPGLHFESEVDAEQTLDHASTPASELTGIQEISGFSGRIHEMREKLMEVISSGATVVIASPYAPQMRRLSGIFQSESLDIRLYYEESELEGKGGPGTGRKTKKPTLYIIKSPQRQGFIIPELNFYLFTDSEIFGRAYRRRSRFKRVGSTPIESFLDLKEGDYVVHVNHGVGRFVALEKVRAAGRERDFLVLEYADEDRLFVPLDQISMVQRYIAPTEKPRLDSLGKSSFKRVKERVEKRIEEFAEELLRLYALRMSRKGFAFPPDTAWQEEFEAAFPFEETPDQIAAIEAVKQDMETARPMDRLVCGDVGYGKTEVAIRAAFKAVMAGRQVAVVAPTTILALQHFRTFRTRFADYPISVDWISRFRSRAEIREIKGRLLRGELDLVIGTHALLGNDVHIRNLGLLVIDEEQRFGVNHKESIKKYKELVDVLTLSATPIPRTLHMSLVGIRDLSIIQTPPGERRPVMTYVMEDNDTMIREAIRRELARDGQVFFLHNRIDSIEAMTLRIQELVPEASIDVIHGRMQEDEIEDILVRFMEARFDVLVTTSIIENGIDMPNVNTLIVDRSDAFGLSQLYQIRGRVGRASRQAYAYFMYPPGRVLTETAQKRLNTILEYQDFGSGFKVAMRDLEIRGAGNVLGREQSGTIMDVGYELYIKLLDDAVHRLQGEAVEAEVRPVINLNTDFYLPEEYIPDTRSRIEFYKRFEGARDESTVRRIAEEMIDRFGPAPASAVTFVDVECIRALAALGGFEGLHQEEQRRVSIEGGERVRVPANHLIACLRHVPGLSIHPGAPNRLRLEIKQPENMLTEIQTALRELVGPIQEQRAAQTADVPESSRKLRTARSAN